MQPEAKKILEDTYKILEERGWCQGVMQKVDGRVCLQGAFEAAVGADMYDVFVSDVQPCAQEAWTAVRYAVADVNGGLHQAPHHWNDEPHRTVEDVKLVLKKAIES
ncbi:DUF6197 family protein [Streptomyces hydrogenans]|uniref:DUF6197 family protein n=1 Tax=Streptomyces hydrogenans TaxID=1873719 RepID=UPI0035DD40C0